jgi:hypothetical protein
MLRHPSNHWDHWNYKELKTYLETIPGKHSLDSVQKTAVLGTLHMRIIRKVLQVHQWFKRGDRKPMDDDKTSMIVKSRVKLSTNPFSLPFPSV